MIDPEVIFDKLDALGSPDAIASFLAAEGCTGDHQAWTCPVSRYVTRETGVGVGITLQFWAPHTQQYISHDRQLPGHVSEFVARFDDGAYPWLHRIDRDQRPSALALEAAIYPAPE